MAHDVGSIARVASAAQAASFKRDYRNVAFSMVQEQKESKDNSPPVLPYAAKPLDVNGEGWQLHQKGAWQ